MTNEKPVGLELDTAVAERVMGDRRESMGWWVSRDGSTFSCANGGPRPYSTDIAAAWQVVERLRAEGWIVRVQEMPDSLPFLAGAGWRVGEGREIPARAVCILHPNPVLEERRGQHGQQVTEFAMSSPEAICRAALRAAAGENTP